MTKKNCAVLHPSLRKPKSGLKSRIHGGRTMHRTQHMLDMDAQSRCTTSCLSVYLCIYLLAVFCFPIVVIWLIFLFWFKFPLLSLVFPSIFHCWFFILCQSLIIPLLNFPSGWLTFGNICGLFNSLSDLLCFNWFELYYGYEPSI